MDAQPAPSLPLLGPSPVARGDRQLSLEQAGAAINHAINQALTEARQAGHSRDSEPLPLLAALGRVLARDVLSPIDVPAHDNSAMDGYAFDGAALATAATAAQPLRLRAAGTVLAGAAAAPRIAAGQCLRIMTGAVMPPGLDTVVPLELCRVDGDPASGWVQLEPGVVQPGENRRHRGEDLTRGKPALQAGRVLRPADLGLLASLGVAEVPVRPRLRVAVFSTGDELRTLGQALEPGCIYDSNRFALMAALQRLGCEPIDLGVVRDDPAALEAALAKGIGQADAVITSGGASAGDADHTRQLLARMGEVGFWKVAMRPGRPFAFGPVRADGRQSWLFALPGNPVAALVTFYVLVLPALLRLAGAQAEPLPLLRARSATPIRKRPGRTELQRAWLACAADGVWQVTPAGSQGAGVLSSMCQANGLLVLAHDQGSVAAGEWVTVLPFDGLV